MPKQWDPWQKPQQFAFDTPIGTVVYLAEIQARNEIIAYLTEISKLHQWDDPQTLEASHLKAGIAFRGGEMIGFHPLGQRPNPPSKSKIPIPYSIRNQHIYIAGKTRHGKSTLIHAMAYQDIKNGQGVCVIDPKGDFVNSLIHWVPEARRNDCIFLSARDPVPMNFMDSRNDDERQTLVGELKHVITRGVAAEAAPLMDAILTDLLYTLFSANDNPRMPAARRATFLDVHRFLSDEARRAFILSFVTDRELARRWNKDNFPNPKECAPTLTRMTPFLRNPALRRLFDCPEPRLNITDVMDSRKVLLVDLGGISEPTKIFATLLIAKIRQAAFRRHSIAESERIPFHLYVDEFEFFQTSDFDQILSFAGGYGLRLTLANQFIGQLDPTIRQSIFGNVGSFIVFCVSPEDARYFKHIASTPNEWGQTTATDLANLPKYRALCKIAGQQPIVKDTPKPPPEARHSHANYIRKHTFETYSVPVSSAESNRNRTNDRYDCPPDDEGLDSAQDEPRKPPFEGGRPRKHQRPT